MKKTELLLLAILIGICSAFSQNYNKYLEATYKHIKTGNYEKAKITYGVYRDMTNKIDSNFERILYSDTVPSDQIEVEEEEDDNVVYQVVEENPEFPGGTKALFEYISSEMKYPTIAAENNIQGRVVCQFTVWKDGTIKDIVVVRGVNPSLDTEAIRVINSMPKWTPGKQRGKAVNVRFTLPILFRLQ